jgi:hypothetical protein
MLALLAAVVLAPWSHPLAFQPLPGWRLGASGTVHSFVGVSSTAWIANVSYLDAATVDPPAKTLRYLPSHGLVV